MDKTKIAIVIPVYDDWDSLNILIPSLDNILADQSVVISLFIVNDASTSANINDSNLDLQLKTISSIEIIHLNCNLGHQRAIATGLVEVSGRASYDVVIIMDGDGEDRPDDIIKMLELYRCNGTNGVIVARRDKRSEGVIFETSYFIYKFIFRLLTGVSVDFGNFCLIPTSLLNKLIYRDSLWNHLSATILRSKIPITMIPTERGKRISGNAKMNFGELVLHGMSAISVYIDKVFLRALFFSMILCSGAIGGISVVIIIRLFTDLAVPGWASNVVGSLLVILILSILLSIFVLFIVLANRLQITMLPAKYSADYINEIETVFER